MRVSGILAAKGATVLTVAPDTPTADVVDELTRRGVGSLVVSTDGLHVEGIVSERDLVRHLSTRGASVLSEPVATVMTSVVHTCTPEDHVDELMRVMTEHRIRHLPVVVDGVLSGIVSIGDVVKRRVTELEDEAQHLHDYITSGR